MKNNRYTAKTLKISGHIQKNGVFMKKILIVSILVSLLASCGHVGGHKHHDESSHSCSDKDMCKDKKECEDCKKTK